MEDGYGLDAVYLDFRKAFDSVPHKRLINRLKECGLSGMLLKWIESFLTSRRMKIGVRGTSLPEEVSSAEFPRAR